ncbi:DUF5686 and carboxypeptidase regulatory-like domain-containing protein [Odoribacter sp. OttesenSCG-928-J03]|nr:DUF5686 and carboxypeptidase regulatory-like domain-containing protein [Odoribacter sp. OttesenSCG-928-J03]MDL2283255.1 DUF5686 and carboxypeptidase regulatory-like domain-containing protein [Odoribacter sp. OttesenSCG-928-G04]MDL2330588.1 DUF5686 and carboxypeptidase regulatory-like domain-containing protein [Odoribacter sp. OttesenSCG-928-A06]
MIKFVLWLSCLILLIPEVEAQSFKGRIVDIRGEAIPGATLFIRELSQGAVADNNGDFQLALPIGEYTCEVSSMGFEKQVLKIRISETVSDRVIRLEDKTYLLPEVRVIRSKEDPAYYIMRNAIARAPFHKNQVISYSSEAYTKGSGHLDKMPTLLLSKEDAKVVKSLLGKTLLLESVQEVKFEAPDTYEQKIIAFSSTIPDDMQPEDALSVITSSIYDPTLMGVVSPVSQGAFSYYRFTYIDAYEEGGRTVCKIKVEPKKKNSQLVSGEIYIEEDGWSVVYFDLQVGIMGATVRVKGVFHEVKEMVYMPTSYEIDMSLKLFGIKAGGKYYSSIKYNDVKTAQEEQLAIEQSKDTVTSIVVKTAKQQKAEKKFAELSEKEELTTRDAYRMAKLAEEIVQEQRRDTVDPLEVKWSYQNVKVSVDSSAMSRDSLFWLKMRTIPLKEDEVQSYVYKDTLKEKVYHVINDSARNNNTSVGNKLLTGGGFNLSKKLSVEIAGLIGAVPEYNFVDGFHLGQKLVFRYRLDKERAIKLMPSVYYVTARKAFNWDVDLTLPYAGSKRGKIALQFGDRSEDYKGNTGAWRLEHAVTTLVAAHNYITFYRNQFANVKGQIHITNGLFVKVEGVYEKRRLLENNISYNFKKKDAKPNTPVMQGGVDMPDNTSTTFSIHLGYTPRMRYYIENGRKYDYNSKWPTFHVLYKKGIPNEADADNVYDRLEFAVVQNVKLGLFDRISYSLSAGQFLKGKNELYFPDYKHFYTVGWAVSERNFRNEYFLADYYQLSTNDKWLSGAFNYESSYLLFKRLPFMQRLLFDEAIHLRYLWTPTNKNYMEGGYSIGFGSGLRAGMFFGFEQEKYKGCGVRVCIPIH